MPSTSGKQAECVRMVKWPINPSPPKHQIFLPNVQILMARLVGDAFVSYQERHLDAIEARWERRQRATTQAGLHVAAQVTINGLESNGLCAGPLK
jgi:hypothetical protein